MPVARSCYYCTERREGELETNETVKSIVGSSHTYTRGILVESDKEWYHGEQTREEAEWALKASGCDCFLIRHNQGDLVLSLVQNGNTTHIPIKYGPGWYKLEGSLQAFSELWELICHYHNSPISSTLNMLGAMCIKTEKSRYDG